MEFHSALTEVYRSDTSSRKANGGPAFLPACRNAVMEALHLNSASLMVLVVLRYLSKTSTLQHVAVFSAVVYESVRHGPWTC